MRKIRLVDERRRRFLVRPALLDFVIAIVSYLIFGPGLFLMFLTIGLFFILLDRLGIPAVELDVGGARSIGYTQAGTSLRLWLKVKKGKLSPPFFQAKTQSRFVGR
ncbi:hypothetical protein [Thermococcus sp. JCM 11816]|uniref:hypothetical protein n=1 Tax=Thermococcus sp. (strain JCM 11816 / KS-1) TaxID=1295125 RepID=UPI000A3F4B38